MKKTAFLSLTAVLTTVFLSSVKAGGPDIAAQFPSATAQVEESNSLILYPGSDIHFQTYSAEQGLSMSVVNTIVQDQQGFLWFGTQDGLNRFDGMRFTILKHNPQDPNSLSANWVQSLHADDAGFLWIGTDGGGLERFNPRDGDIVHFRADENDPESISSNFVLSMYEDKSGYLWVATKNGLDRFNRDTGKFTHLNKEPGAPEVIKDGKVNAIIEGAGGVYWIATQEGLLKYSSQTRTFNEFKSEEDDPTSLSHNWVTTLFQDRSGTFWIGTESGLNRLNDDGKSFTRFLYKDPENIESSFKGVHIKTINDASDKALWIGTWGNGLVYFEPESGKLIEFRNELGNNYSLSSDYILDIFHDRSGSVWFGTFGGGLSRLDPETLNFVHYRRRLNSQNSIASSSIWSIFENDGILWLGTDLGLDRLDRSTGAVTHYAHDPQEPNSLSANAVYAIMADYKGKLWVGTGGGGINRFDPETDSFTTYKTDPDDPDSISDNMIFGILEDHESNLWIATYSGLNRFNRDTDTFTRYLTYPEDDPNQKSECIYAMIEGREGVIWLGTHSGLYLFNPKTEKSERIKLLDPTGSVLDELSILTILEDEQGELWIGTVGRGMLHFNPANGTTKSYTEVDGMPNDTAYGILQDGSGNLWISTNNGLSNFDLHTEVFKTYLAKDGLQSNEYNSFAFFQNDVGEMFFGGINGVSAFVPSNIQDNTFLPPVVLTSLRTPDQNGTPQLIVDSEETFVLSHPKDSFEFEFASLNFVQPERNQYAYRLEGFDNDWIQLGNKNFGRYTNLPGGKYTLHLKASNNAGVWNEEGKSIRIQVIPPLWETAGFRLGVVIFGLLCVFAGYRLRMHGVISRSRQLESMIQERTSEIERRRQELEALYRADEALYRNLQLDQVLQALVESAVELLHADKGALLVLDKDSRCLTPRVTYGFKPETIESLSFAVGEGIAGIVAETGEPIITQDAVSDSRVPRHIQDAEGIHSIMQVPIKVGGEVFGVFSADFLQPHSFGDEELRLLMSLAQRAGLAIQNAQLYEQTQEKAVAEERNRLARELHDAVTQTLFSASLIAEALPTAFDSDPEEGHDLLNELRQLNRGALAEMRALLLELRPTALAESNLEDLLRQLGEAAAGREGIPVDVVTNGHSNLPPDVHIAFYRIAQEALNNALKHARSESVQITLSHYQETADNGDGKTQQGIMLAVSDDGCGFDQKNTPSDHLGLKIMRERAQSIGAQLNIESEPGRGTRISVLWKN